MKVRVTYVVRAEDDFRMAICHSWGDCGRLATREEIKNYCERVGTAQDDDLMQEWADCPECQAEVAR